MDNKLLNKMKDDMIYIRSNSKDKKVEETALALKESISRDVSTENPLEAEQFILYSLDLLLEAIQKEEFLMVYDISDMLQGMPNVEYWQLKKNMRYYWRDYVIPVEKRWQIEGFYKYKPTNCCSF